MLFDDFGTFFAQGAENSAINDRFYKGSPTGLCSLRESRFPPAISRVSKIAEVHYRMLINIMLFDDLCILFAHGASKSSRNDRFYKGSEIVFHIVRESMFPKEC